MRPVAVRAADPDHEVPYYRSVEDECDVFRFAHANRLPLLLKGPTGCGKSRLVEAMAARLGRPLVTVACNDDTSASDLLGRWLLRGGDTVWQDGPVTRAVREGAILYLDEIAEAREDVIVVLHPLSDHRRTLHLDRHDETLAAPAGFMLVASFNPGYRRGPKDLKPSTRQRFLALCLDYPEAAVEAEIVQREGGVDAKTARRLVALGHKIRSLSELGLTETASTRLLIAGARLIAAGLPPRSACRAAVVQPLSDDPTTLRAMQDVVDLML